MCLQCEEVHDATHILIKIKVPIASIAPSPAVVTVLEAGFSRNPANPYRAPEGEVRDSRDSGTRPSRRGRKVTLPTRSPGISNLVGVDVESEGLKAALEEVTDDIARGFHLAFQALTRDASDIDVMPSPIAPVMTMDSVIKNAAPLA